jgi:urease accessory protein
MDGSSIRHSLQRATGHISFVTDQNRVKRLYQSGSAKLLLPRTHRDMTEAVILNTAGGLTGGDEFKHHLTTRESQLVVTSQAAERIYKSSSGPVEINICLNASDGSVLHWLPQETIFFNKCRLNRNIELHMSADSECLISESMVLGRLAMGETITDCSISENWRIYRDDQLAHAESIRIKGDVNRIVDSAPGLGGAKMMTTILYLGPQAENLGNIILSTSRRCPSNCAVSYWNEKLVVRLVTDHVPTGRSDTMTLLCQLRQQEMPRMWQT